MAKTAQLTLGLSLCRLKIPSFLLQSRLGELSLPNCSFSSVSRGLRLKSHPARRQPCSEASLQIPRNDDVKLDLLNLPKIASQCIKGRDKVATAGGTLPGMRFIVYLASLALSLAALSILKLQKLLAWLAMKSRQKSDHDTANLSSLLVHDQDTEKNEDSWWQTNLFLISPEDSHGSTATIDRQDLQSKSSLISEIIRAVIFRYSRHNPHDCSSAPSLSSFTNNPASNSYSQTHLRRDASGSTSTSPVKSLHSFFQELCFHARGFCNSMSEQCLLCLVRGLDERLDSSGLFGRQRRSSSESITSSPLSSPRWPKPSRVNAGICRSQVASDTSPWCLSVEMCSPSAPVSEKLGLCLASAVRRGASRIWRISPMPFYSHCHRKTAFRRTQKLVACVAPTTVNHMLPIVSLPTSPIAQSSSAPLKFPLDNGECQKLASSTPFRTIIEENEPELETIPFTDEPLAVTMAAVTSTPVKPLLPSGGIPVTHRDCGVYTRVTTRDSICSPVQFSDEESSQLGEHPDADGLELDDEGVYFAYDYRAHVSCHEEVGIEEIDDFEPNISQGSQDAVECLTGEGFSDLVALTNSISDDLIQLESGCQELIQRVHANRIELDRVDDSLSFVWDFKDECAGATVYAVEKTQTSINGASRYNPTGASIISNKGSCCACNCHFVEKDLSYRPSPVSDTLSSLTIVHPVVSFEENNVKSCIDHQSSPHHCSPSNQCLVPNLATFQSGA